MGIDPSWVRGRFSDPFRKVEKMKGAKGSGTSATFPRFGKRIFKRKITSHASGNEFSSEKLHPTLRETNFQAKNYIPRFGKRIFERNKTSHTSGNNNFF